LFRQSLKTYSNARYLLLAALLSATIVACLSVSGDATGASGTVSLNSDTSLLPPWDAEWSCNVDRGQPTCSGRDVIRLVSQADDGAAPREGSKMVRVEAQPGDYSSLNDQARGTRTHAELLTHTVWPLGGTRWLGFSVYFPKGFDFQDSSGGGFFIATQWHAVPPGAASNQFRVNAATGHLEFWNKTSGVRADLGLVEGSGDGRWIDVAVGLKCSQSGDGSVEVWANGVKIVSRTGISTLDPTLALYDTGSCWQVRQGIYRNTDGPKNVIYYDSTRMGSTLDDVAPWLQGAAIEPAPEPPPATDTPTPSESEDQATEPTPTEPTPTEPTPTEPTPTEPAPTEPTQTEEEPTAPEPDQPAEQPADQPSHHTPGPHAHGHGLDRPHIRSFRYVSDEGCLNCLVAMAHGRLWATVTSPDEKQDSAYGRKGLGLWSGRVWTRTEVALKAPSTLEGNLVLMQVRDAHDVLVYQVVASSSDRTITVVGPPGGLDGDGFRLDSGIVLGPKPRRIEVAAKANDSIAVRVDGRLTNLLDGLRGARTTGQRFVRAGIVNYSGSAAKKATVVHRSVGASTAGWLGARTRSLAVLRRPQAMTRKRLGVRLEGIPTSHVRILVRGPHGRALGRGHGRLGPHGVDRVLIRLRRWEDQRRLRLRIRSTYRGSGLTIVKRESRPLRLTAPARRRLARG
jgi:polysaccharide lyase-like protein